MTREEPQDPSALAGLVEYQSGAVVSRTILKRSTGNLTLFAFDRGEGLSEHTTPHDAFVLLLDGAAEIVIGDRTVRAEAGEAVLLPADVPHALHAVEPFKMLLAMIRER